MRLTQAFVSLCYWGLGSGVAIGFVHGKDPGATWIAATTLVPVTLAVALRGFRLSLEADRQGVLLRNLWTTRRLLWKDVHEVKAGKRYMGRGGSLPTIVFVKAEGSVVAHGVPTKRADRDDDLYELRKLAPASIRFPDGH